VTRREKKEWERHILDLFGDATGCLPSGPAEDSETPDFLFGAEGLGVEVTEFFLPARPGQQPQQEVLALRKRVVSEAWRLYSAAGGRAAYVTVFFKQHALLRKGTVQSDAVRLAEAMLLAPVPADVHAPGLTIGWPTVPDSVAQVTVTGSVDGTDSLWYPSNSGWVAPIEPAFVAQCIAAKAPRAPSARLRCNELWLLIAHYSLTRGAAAELSERTAEFRYLHPFDRVFWFEALTGVVVELTRG
jgi:hypothetical protein